MFRINKQKCMGCGVCANNCPRATKIGLDGKAEIVDQEKLEKCRGKDICPMGAIEEVSEEKQPEQKTFPSLPYKHPLGGRGLGRGRGPGWSRGTGRKWRGGRG
jgi:formate hydrogenlyase subunit 6/NADH:ubiquinone oxidoreductase subunit I